jgi:hypothetical protein
MFECERRRAALANWGASSLRRAGDDATIDGKNSSGDVARSIGGEKHCGFSDIAPV